MDAIAVNGLTKNYRGRAVLDRVDLTLAAGETLALLGPNGAGKTTTVELLAGLRRPDSGEIRVLGADPWRASRAWRERVGMVLQEHLTSAELTVAELLASTAACYPRPWDADTLLEAFGLLEHRARRVKVLSGGQRRRLDVALGVVGRPEVLFLDEPTTGLDPEARREMWQLVRRLCAGGTSVLLTTHYLDEVEQLADRVAVLVDGRVVAVDVPDALGGRARAEAMVRWREDGCVRTLRTGAPSRLIGQLAARFDGEIPELAVTRPSLEDVYVELIAAAS